MHTFINQVANIILNDFEDLREIQIIVPNNRTKAYLIRSLKSQTTKTIWLPSIVSIKDIFYSKTKLTEAENLKLIYKLYKTFIEHTKSSESIDDFYYWGEIILNDFDDIDKYLVDAQKLFDTIKDINTIDSQFNGYEVEVLEIAKKFWTNINEATSSEHKEYFLKLWNAMFDIYSSFKEDLYKNNIAYQGMIYRDFIDKINNYKIEFKTHLIVGFNALNNCEKELFNFLKNKSTTHFLWDIDNYYVEDKYQEAGLFVRENIKKYPQYHNLPIVDGIINNSKNIEIVTLPSPISQTKLIADILTNWKKESDYNHEKTAIILGDEEILIPLMYSIPSEFEPYNISMGFPVKTSLSANFVLSLISLQKNCRANEFYYKDVFNIIRHPFIKDKIQDSDNKINELVNLGTTYLNADIIVEDYEILALIFSKKSDTLSLSNYFLKICETTLNNIFQNENLKIESEFLSRIYQRISSLNDCLFDEIEIKKDTYTRLLRKSLNSISVAFEGEPLLGMQILGFLETRNLDFDRVILLSMNEGDFPKKSAGESLIPYNLRRFHQLPSIEFQDSIFAYYFYRILQKVKDIKILHYSHSSDKQSEVSRFVTQIKYELKNTNPEIKFSDKNIGYNVILDNKKPNSAEISKQGFEILKNIFNRGISPSAINAYLNCKFKFYLNYIENIKAPEIINEDNEAMVFGNLFHNSMYYLYKDLVGKEICKKDLLSINNEENINNALKYSILKVYKLKESDNLDEYINSLIVSIVKVYINNMIDYDMNNLPFKIIGLEESVEYVFDTDRNIKIKGFIDRIDYKNAEHIILDYKTGKADLNIKNIDKLFEQDRLYKSNNLLQIILYSYLYTKSKNIISSPGILNINLLLDNYCPNILIDNKQFDMDSIINTLEDHLNCLFNEILDPDNSFTQTTKKENCTYCDYQKICTY